MKTSESIEELSLFRNDKIISGHGAVVSVSITSEESKLIGYALFPISYDIYNPSVKIELGIVKELCSHLSMRIMYRSMVA